MWENVHFERVEKLSHKIRLWNYEEIPLYHLYLQVQADVRPQKTYEDKALEGHLFE